MFQTILRVICYASIFAVIGQGHVFAADNTKSSKNKEAKKDAGCGCDKVSKAAALTAECKAIPEGMVEVPAGTFNMGATGPDTKPDEGPVHKVKLNAFYMDETEVTNEQFEKFVKATGHKTTAEKPVDWELLKQQVPPGTPKPPEDKLAPGSLVFMPSKLPVPLHDHTQWWQWENGADWKRPRGPGSESFGKDHPVVHVSWEDAQAYCKWQGKRLPTEAEREWAARGGLEGKKYPWGDDETDDKNRKANIWEGGFPYKNTKKEHQWTSPVKQYAPNAYGLYDMAGNVWEWTADQYDVNYYARLEKQGLAVNPINADKSHDPDEPGVTKYVLRGGSFMCHHTYCWGYRVSARMKTSPDSSLVNLGFRCSKDKSK